MEDKTIKCDCGNEFEFTVGEQNFYQQRGFSTPKRCPDCRAKKKARDDRGHGSVGLDPIRL